MTEEEKESVSLWEATGFFLTHWTALKAVITAAFLFLGYGTATNETVQSIFKPQVDVPVGELVDEIEEEDNYAIAIRAINAKLKQHDEDLHSLRQQHNAALQSLRQASNKGDDTIELRVQLLEEHH